jgi:hypothetical protein
MRLGYQHHNDLCKLTAYLSEHMRTAVIPYCFSPISIKVDGEEYNVMGVTINTECDLNYLEGIVSQLRYVFMNKASVQPASTLGEALMVSSSQEKCLLVAENEEVIQAYYTRKFESEVADRVCRKFNFFRDGEGKNEEQIARYEEQMREELAHLHHMV